MRNLFVSGQGSTCRIPVHTRSSAGVNLIFAYQGCFGSQGRSNHQNATWQKILPWVVVGFARKMCAYQLQPKAHGYFISLSSLLSIAFYHHMITPHPPTQIPLMTTTVPFSIMQCRSNSTSANHYNGTKSMFRTSTSTYICTHLSKCAAVDASRRRT